MKKSELVYKIKSLLDNLEGVCSNSIKATTIVSEIEKVGMTPPETTKVRKFNNTFEIIEQVREWEE